MSLESSAHEQPGATLQPTRGHTICWSHGETKKSKVGTFIRVDSITKGNRTAHPGNLVSLESTATAKYRTNKTASPAGSWTETGKNRQAVPWSLPSGSKNLLAMTARRKTSASREHCMQETDKLVLADITSSVKCYNFGYRSMGEKSLQDPRSGISLP
jgi:hypothetical protein